MKTKNLFLTLTIFLGLAMTSFAQPTSHDLGDHPPLQTVASVDLNRYQGTWYQIAYLPNRFQKNCEVNVTAQYTLRDDGKVTVFNQCFKNNGTRKSIQGYAYPATTETNARLKVKFFWFAPAGDYWVMELGSDYEYAVVGTPNRKNLWILSRSPHMPTVQYEELLKKAEAQSFDVSEMKITSALLEEPRQ